MIIKKATAEKLIAMGKAVKTGYVWVNPYTHEPDYIGLINYQQQRTDHYPCDSQDIDNWHKNRAKQHLFAGGSV